MSLSLFRELMAGDIIDESETGLLLVSPDTTSIYDLPIEDLNAKYNTSLNTGLQLNHAERQQQRQVVGANIIPPPVDCPPWLCCLLPCLLKTKKMKYYQSLQAKVVEVLLHGKFTHMDPTGLLVGDVVKITAGMHVPADVRLLKITESPCLFDTRAITGEGSSFSEREGVVDLCEKGEDNALTSSPQSHHYSGENLGNMLDPVNNLNVVCAGFLCTGGECVAVVVAAGGGTVLSGMISRKEWPPLT